MTLYISTVNSHPIIWCCFHLFRPSASSFNSHYLLLFLKSSRSCVLLFPTPFTSIICLSMASWRRQFLVRIWPIHLAFLCRILFRSVLFSPIRSRTCSLVTFSDHFPPAPHFKADEAGVNGIANHHSGYSKKSKQVLIRNCSFFN